MKPIEEARADNNSGPNDGDAGEYVRQARDADRAGPPLSDEEWLVTAEPALRAAYLALKRSLASPEEMRGHHGAQ